MPRLRVDADSFPYLYLTDRLLGDRPHFALKCGPEETWIEAKSFVASDGERRSCQHLSASEFLATDSGLT